MKYSTIATIAILLLTTVGCGGGISAPLSTPDEISDFGTNPTAYEGKTLAMQLRYGGPPLTQSEVDEATWNAPFQAKGTPTKGDPYDFFMVIAIPKGIRCPKLSDGDEVTVVFQCTTGQLTEGNYAQEIQ